MSPPYPTIAGLKEAPALDLAWCSSVTVAIYRGLCGLQGLEIGKRIVRLGSAMNVINKKGMQYS